MTIPSVPPNHVEDDEHSEQECDSCAFSQEEEDEEDEKGPSSYSNCIGISQGEINKRMMKTVTAIISNGSIIEESDYFHTSTDKSGRIVFTPNLNTNSKKPTTFLPLISNIVRLSDSGDYYIKCRSQPTDEDITSIFGPDCLVQVIKVDAIYSNYHDTVIDTSSSECRRHQQPSSTHSAHSISSVLSGKAVSTACCPADADTSFSASNEVDEISKLDQSNFENDLQRQLEKFGEERQEMQKQIDSLISQNQLYCLQTKKHEDEKRNLQECLKEMESKLHQTSDILMKEIDFISTKVLLLQNELTKVYADKAALQEEIENLHSRQIRRNGKFTESFQRGNQVEENAKEIYDQNIIHSTDWNAVATNESHSLSLPDTKNISHPSSRWNHHLSAIPFRGLKVVQLFNQATSEDVVEPDHHHQTQSSTASTIRRLSKTSFPDVLHKCKLGPDSSTTYDNEYDIQSYEENVNTKSSVPNPNALPSLQTCCDKRPRRLALFRRSL